MFLRTFGCACWPNLRPYNNRKLQFRSRRCVFLGYSNLHKGFKSLDPFEGRIYISRDVFDEHVFPFSQMHPNAGARLRAELVVLPDVVLNPSSSFGMQFCLINIILSLPQLMLRLVLARWFLLQGQKFPTLRLEIHPAIHQMAELILCVSCAGTVQVRSPMWM